MNKVYTAPDGKVYDWANPHMATIKEVDGSVIERVEHLYVKYLSISHYDTIDNYILVDDPRSGANV